jgi:DNA-nicking Smr family endonuclease
MAGVKPLAGRDKLRPAPEPERRGPPRSRAEPVHFEVERLGERLEGRAPGIDRRHLRRLRAGRVPVDARIDLHGLEVPAARRALQAALVESFDSGARCLLVVHGRGLHSREEPALKDSLVGWLEAAPVGPSIMAFASATAEDGGPGATYVLLRRGS